MGAVFGVWRKLRQPLAEAPRGTRSTRSKTAREINTKRLRGPLGIARLVTARAVIARSMLCGRLLAVAWLTRVDGLATVHCRWSMAQLQHNSWLPGLMGCAGHNLVPRCAEPARGSPGSFLVINDLVAGDEQVPVFAPELRCLIEETIAKRLRPGLPQHPALLEFGQRRGTSVKVHGH